MSINGVVHEKPHVDQEFTRAMPPKQSRDIRTVVAAMLMEIPERDKLVFMLDGIMKANALFACSELGPVAWQSVVGAMQQRIQLFEGELPEWFVKVAAIFRGDA